jgi:hypothetical protein
MDVMDRAEAVAAGELPEPTADAGAQFAKTTSDITHASFMTTSCAPDWGCA